MLICCQKSLSCFRPKICQLFPVPVQILGPDAVLLWTRAAATQANKPIKTTMRAVSVGPGEALQAAQRCWQHFCKSLILSTDAASDAKRSVPPTASDSSSSGGSDSEEDDKTTSGPPNTISTCVPGNKPDHLKRLVHYFPNCESVCGAVGAAETHKTAASGWSSYIWHITTRFILMTDWTVFFPPGLQMWRRSLYSELSQLFFCCFIHWLCAANSICALGWCHIKPVCHLSGICVIS